MKHLRLPSLSALSFLFFVAAAPFPGPLSSERAISNPAFVPAAGMQHDVQAASNGEIGLVLWNDDRAGASTRIMGTRVDERGIPLDPLSLDFGAARLTGLAFNGEHFVIVGDDDGTPVLSFVTPHGAIVRRRALERSFEFVAKSDGEDVRLLFLSRDAAMVVDGDGEVVATTPIAADLSIVQTAAARDAEFLVLRRHYTVDSRPSATTALRIRDDGAVLAATDAHLAHAVGDRDAAASTSNGFVVVRTSSTTGAVTMFRLDAQGVYTGETHTLLAPFSGVRAGDPSIVRRSGESFAAWTTQQGGVARVYAARIPDDGAPAQPQLVWEFIGVVFDLVPAEVAGQALVFVTAQTHGGAGYPMDTFSLRLDQPMPILLANTAERQHDVVAAAGANGGLVSWIETGGGASHRIHARRVAHDGEPQDAQPLHVTTTNFTPPPPALASNGGVYLVVWYEGRFFGRRLSAITGQWIDGGPFLIGGGSSLVAASNGTDAMVAWIDGGFVKARRIPLAGEPLRDPEVRVTADAPHGLLSLASNGADYLLAWAAGWRDCNAVPCFQPPPDIVAARLRADATVLDPLPVVLAEEFSGDRIATAWDGTRYTVAWTLFRSVRGARLTAQGTVTERDVLVRETPNVVLDAKLVRHGDALVLFTKETAQRQTMWVMGSLDPAAPRATVLRAHDDIDVSLDAASSGAKILVAYDRVAASAGHVRRVFVRIFGETAGRRRAVR
jgi:hypothetical protein